MPIVSIPIDQDNDRSGWLALREPDVTASTVGALFGVSPHTTRAELYWSKKGVPMARNFSERMMEWREDLEAVFPKRVRRKRPEWRLEKATEYLRDTDLRLGATPDFFVYGDPRGLGVLQAKTADRRAFRRDWSDGNIPFWIILQNSVELMLKPEAAFGGVAVITVEEYKSETEIFEIPRVPKVEEKIRDAVEQFWIDVAFSNEPDLDAQRDQGLIAALFPDERTNKTIDLSSDNELPHLMAERADLKAAMKPMETRVEAINAELIAKMRDAEAARVGDFFVTYKRSVIAPKPATPGGLGSRRLQIIDHREKEPKDNGQSSY